MSRTMVGAAMLVTVESIMSSASASRTRPSTTHSSVVLSDGLLVPSRGVASTAIAIISLVGNRAVSSPSGRFLHSNEHVRYDQVRDDLVCSERVPVGCGHEYSGRGTAQPPGSP